jgi:hypothetical protein
MLRSIATIVAVGGIAATTIATLKPAEAGNAAGCKPHYGYPDSYYGFQTYYYGGFYTPRVVFAPCVYGSYDLPYGYFVRYRNVRRYW